MAADQRAADTAEPNSRSPKQTSLRRTFTGSPFFFCRAVRALLLRRSAFRHPASLALGAKSRRRRRPSAQEPSPVTFLFHSNLQICTHFRTLVFGPRTARGAFLGSYPTSHRPTIAPAKAGTANSGISLGHPSTNSGKTARICTSKAPLACSGTADRNSRPIAPQPVARPAESHRNRNTRGTAAPASLVRASPPLAWVVELR